MSVKRQPMQEDRILTLPSGDPVEKWIYSAFERDHWVARKPGDLVRADSPGTAVRMGDDLYEIVVVEATAEPGFALRYGLKKWDPQYPLRGLVAYTPQTQAQSAADFLEESRAQSLRSRIVWLFPLAGMAPDPLQREWEASTALNMTLIAAASALTQILVFLGIMQSFGGTPGNPRAAFIVEYLGADGFLRLLMTVCTGTPRGVFVLSLPYLVWELAVHPEKRKRKKEAELKLSLDPDETIRRPGSGHLTVRSMVYDDLLAGSEAIRFEGALYKPIHWHREGKGLERRWVYEFEKLEGEAKVRFRDFTRPRSPQRQMAVEQATRALDRVQILGLIWGTYPAREQLRLEAQYQFPAARMTAATAGLLLACGALEAWALRLLGAPPWFFAASLYFVLESLFRLYVSKAQGRPCGSLVGWVLQAIWAAP